MGIARKTTTTILLLCLMGCSKTTAPPPAAPTETPKASKSSAAKKSKAAPAPQPTKEKPTTPPSSAPLAKPEVQEASKPVFKLYVKSEKLKAKSIEGGDEVDSEDQYRTSLIEGDLKKPTRVTKLLEGPANCGPMANAIDEGAGEEKLGIIYFLVCWNAGVGHTIEFVQDGQTISVKRSSVSEDEEDADYVGPGDGEIHTFKVPKGVKVEFEHL